MLLSSSVGSRCCEHRSVRRCSSLPIAAPIPKQCTTQEALSTASCFHRHVGISHRQDVFYRRPLVAARAELASSGSAGSEDDIVRVATIGDIVTLHFVCKDEQGNVVESTRALGEPMSFEVGAGEVMGNKLFQGFDEAVRGLAVGQETVIEAAGGEWRRELLFSVPRDHPEIARLEGRYKNHGGLKEGLVVELANNSLAVVVEYGETAVKLDANSMLAGKVLTFELEVVRIDKAPDATA